MKKIIGYTAAILAGCLAVHKADAQTPNAFVGVGTTTPKAKLDIVSDTSGVLVPRYATKTLADAVLPKLNASDHKGLLIFIAEAANQGFWYYDGTAWVKSGGSSPFFKVSSADANHIIYSDMSNKGKNFIVNADSTNWRSGNEYKLFFRPDKAAFRVGAINDKGWDKDSIGQFSFAAGSYTKAKGVNATALGDGTKALGYASTAMNRGSTTSGDQSLAGGSFSTAIGSQSIAFGNSAVAKGDNSVAFGEYDSTIGNSSLAVGNGTRAIGNYSIVGGNNSRAIGDQSVAFGQNTVAKGSNSFAIGSQDSANGWQSVAMGYGTRAAGTSSFAVGERNYALGDQSVAMGKNTSALATNSFTMGEYTVATGQNTVAFGSYDSAIAYNSIALGANTKSTGTSSLSFGSYTVASGTQSIAGGGNSISTGFASFAFGSSDSAKGSQSVAFGSNTVASGTNSFTMGDNTKATSNNDVAIGQYSKATGGSSFAMGNNSTASGNLSVAMGNSTTASNNIATAMGNSTTASGGTSIAMGNFTTASGSTSTAMGNNTTASGSTSTAMGSNSKAAGDFTTAMGINTIANSYGEVVLGSYNDTLNAFNKTTYKGDTNRVFTVGAGTSAAPKTAFVIQQNGKVGINTHIADTTLHVVGGIKYVDGNQATGKVLTSDANGLATWQTAAGGGSGTAFFKVSTADTNHIIYSSAANYGKNFIVNADSTNWKSGIESKLFFRADKYAFRVGAVNNKNWDKDNIGNFSFASGFGTVAKGNTSTAMGLGTNAIGDYSTAMGNNTTAKGNYSTAMGNGTKASGNYSTAMGNATTANGYNATAMGASTANGDYSTTMGSNTIAQSYGEVAIGFNNDTLKAFNAGTFSADTNRVFTVGTGASGSSPKTAFVIQQNGNVGVGTRVATSNLQLGGAISMPFKAITTSTTLDNTHHTVRFSGSTASQTVTLPTASTCSGRMYRIINAGSVALGVSSYTNYSGTSTTSIVIGTAILVQSDGTNWYQVP